MVSIYFLVHTQYHLDIALSGRTYIQVMRSADKKGFTRKDLAIGLAKQYQKFFKNRAKYKVWVKDISCIGINAISYKSRYMCSWVWT